VAYFLSNSDNDHTSACETDFSAFCLIHENHFIIRQHGRIGNTDETALASPVDCISVVWHPDPEGKKIRRPQKMTPAAEQKRRWPVGCQTVELKSEAKYGLDLIYLAYDLPDLYYIKVCTEQWGTNLILFFVRWPPLTACSIGWPPIPDEGTSSIAESSGVGRDIR